MGKNQSNCENNLGYYINSNCNETLHLAINLLLFDHFHFDKTNLSLSARQATKLKASVPLLKSYLKISLPKQDFHTAASFVVKSSVMIADSSFQGTLEYVFTLDKPYAVHNLF